jgi:hypothetical protein
MLMLVYRSRYGNNTGAPDWPGAYLTPVDMPDVILQGVARYRSEFRNHTDFYARAAAGTLPAVSWVHPPGPMMDHPCHVSGPSVHIVIRTPPPASQPLAKAQLGGAPLTLMRRRLCAGYGSWRA